MAPTSFLADHGYNPHTYEADAHAGATDGVPYRLFGQFAAAAGVSEAKLASVLGWPTSTHGRRKRKGALAPTESERHLRLMKLFDAALELFAGDNAATGRWFFAPRPALDGARPVDLVTTEFGGRMVERLIGRLVHGVYT